MEQEVDKIKLVEEMLKQYEQNNKMIEKYEELISTNTLYFEREIKIKEQEKEKTKRVVVNVKAKKQEYGNNKNIDAYNDIIEQNTKKIQDLEEEIRDLNNQKDEMIKINNKKIAERQKEMPTDKNIQLIAQGIKDIDKQIEERKFEIKEIELKKLKFYKNFNKTQKDDENKQNVPDLDKVLDDKEREIKELENKKGKFEKFFEELKLDRAKLNGWDVKIDLSQQKKDKLAENGNLGKEDNPKKEDNPEKEDNKGDDLVKKDNAGRDDNSKSTVKTLQRPDFLGEMEKIEISKEGVYVGDYLFQDEEEMLETYKNKEGLSYNDGNRTYVVNNVREMLNEIFIKSRTENDKLEINKMPIGKISNISKKVIKKIDPNVLMAINYQADNEIISNQELVQCVSMYLAALNGDKGSQEMLKGIITYDKNGIDYLKPSNLVDRIINVRAYRKIRKFADSHKSFATIISDVKGKIRAKLSKGNENIELLDSPKTQTTQESTTIDPKANVNEELKVGPEVVRRIEELGRRANNPQPINQNPEPQKESPENSR